MRVLGHEFAEMTRNDRYAFCDATPETLICHLSDEKTTLLFDPATRQIEEHIFNENADGSDDYTAFCWTPVQLA